MFQAHTPMLQQYFRTREENPGVLLFMRVGDFFELYGDDAEVAARELEITLTGREDGPNGRIPMAGVPFHAVERYAARLLAKGHKVALCDQVEDPRQAKGLVKRRVTRVLTPGTVLEDSMLDSTANNYLVAAITGADLAGLGVVDVTTGEFLTTEISGETSLLRLVQEVQRLSPAECLVPADAEALLRALEDATSATITPIPREEIPRTQVSRQDLLAHFGVASLRGYGCEEFSAGLDAAACVLRYLRRSHVTALDHIRSLSTYSVDRFMNLDSTARRNLELTRSLSDGSKRGTLADVLDLTRSPMGARLLRRRLLEPLQEIDAIDDRLDGVAQALGDAITRDAARQRLSRLGDMERLFSRVATGVATPRDLAALRDSLRELPQFANELAPFPDGPLGRLCRQLRITPEPEALLARALADEPPATVRDPGIIRDGYHPELDEIRRAQREGRQWIAALETEQREATGIPSLKVGYNAVFGYYLEVTKTHLSRVPEHYIRKQTTANAERYITPELKEMEARISGAEERAAVLEQDLFQQLRGMLTAYADPITSAARALAEIDVLCACAECAARYGWVRPSVHEGYALRIDAGRHPVIERLSSSPFVPNDIVLDESQRMIILTGPNMAGKSTYLRQTALIVLMAHIGSFVPAARADIPLVDRIFTRVGAHDELATGQSTFMVEMTETAEILNHATERSLVILDEIGRGTSTYDGLAIAWSVAEYLNAVGCKTLFATHYHYLNELANQAPTVRNYRVTVREQGDRIIWLHKILPGGTDRSYGIQVARMAGAPPEMVARAAEVLRDLEKSGQRGAFARAEAEPRSDVKLTRKKLQLTLFDLDRHPVLDELEQLDIDTLSPVEALLKLAEWKRQL